MDGWIKRCRSWCSLETCLVRISAGTRTVLRALVVFLRPSRHYAQLSHKNLHPCPLQLATVCNLARRRGGHVTGIGFTKTACCFIQTLTVRQLVMKFFAFYGTPTVRDRDHNSPLPVPVLSQSNMALKLPPSFVNIQGCC